MKRRDFIKATAGGVAAIAVGSKMGGFAGSKTAEAAIPITTIVVTITDAIQEMHCFNGVPEQQDPNSLCYFWCYQMSVEFADNPGVFVDYPPSIPGPTLFATQGDTVNIEVINTMTRPHALFIPGLLRTGPIAPGASVVFLNRRFRRTGSFLYYDNLNAPVNRVMGLHGALVVMPNAPSGPKWTPYNRQQITAPVQRLFNQLGVRAWWPGLSWEDEDPATLTPPFRQYVWLCSQASQKLFAEVGDTPGIYPRQDFARFFRRDVFTRDSFTFAGSSRIPQHFTITGKQGHFCHNNAIITPMSRVGEPVVVRVMNAGLMTHSMHLHANHFYILAVDGVVQGRPNPADPSLTGPGVIWIDTMTLNPFGEASSQYDMLVPYMRPPDVPNARGIGRGGSPDAALLSDVGQRVWPPFEEFNLHLPDAGTAFGQDPQDPNTLIPVSLAVRMSPLCYPMHDHSEPTQSTQGGNYNTALISGAYFIGDRNSELPRFNINDNPALPLLPPMTFPMDEDFAMMLGLSQTPQILAYGIDEARRRGIQEPDRFQDLESVQPRPNFPPGFNDPAV